jgi:hypothetical protein
VTSTSDPGGTKRNRRDIERKDADCASYSSGNRLKIF